MDYFIEAVHAAGMGDACIDELKGIIQRNHHFLNMTNKSKDTLLIVASSCNNLQTVIYLCQQQGINLNAHSPDRGTALHVAINEGFDEVSQVLIEAGADMDIECTIEMKGFGGSYKQSITPRNLLMQNGRIDLLEVSQLKNNRLL